jgi:hypothetical protein
MAVPPTEAALIKFMEEWLTGLIGPLSAEGADRPDRRRYWAKAKSNQVKEWRKRIRVKGIGHILYCFYLVGVGRHFAVANTISNIGDTFATQNRLLIYVHTLSTAGRAPALECELRCKPTPDFFYLPGPGARGPAWLQARKGRPQAAAPIGAAALLWPGSGGSCVRPCMCHGCSSADAGDSRLHTAARAVGPTIYAAAHGV